ncbi:MAG: hypothetical protein WCG80_16930 [Spirochaetales bacterium]
MTAQLDLFASASYCCETFPDWFGHGIGGKSEDDDRRFDVERLPEVKTKAGRYHVSLRAIEGGVWLWGVRYGTNTAGGGFAPFRKWGPSHAAMIRAAAVQAATEYALKRLDSLRS